MQSSPPTKKHRGILSTHVLTSSSLLDTLALSGTEKSPSQLSPPSQTLSESLSNQRPVTTIPTAQSLRSTSPTGRIPASNLSSSADSVRKKLTLSDFPSQGNLPEPVIITKSKMPQKSKSADAITTLDKTVKATKRPHVAKSPSGTFNTKDLPGMCINLFSNYIYVCIV